MNVLKKKLILVIAGAAAAVGLFLALSYVFHDYDDLFGEKLYCEYFEIDFVNGKTRTRKFIFYSEAEVTEHSNRSSNWLPEYISENNLTLEGSDWKMIGGSTMNGRKWGGTETGKIKLRVEEVGLLLRMVDDLSEEEEHTIKLRVLEAFRQKDLNMLDASIAELKELMEPANER